MLHLGLAALAVRVGTETLLVRLFSILAVCNFCIVVQYTGLFCCVRAIAAVHVEYLIASVSPSCHSVQLIPSVDQINNVLNVPEFSHHGDMTCEKYCITLAWFRSAKLGGT